MPSFSASTAPAGRRRPALTAVTAVAVATLLAAAGCSGSDSGSDSGDQGGQNSRHDQDGQNRADKSAAPGDLTSQKLDWKACPTPSAAEGGGTAPPRCPAAPSGSAPP